MYTSFFGFTENPFNLTPDPRYLFLSHHHKDALDHLLYGINERKGFIVITGGIGTGKTTLCRVLLNHLGSHTRSALIFNSFISDIELLKAINQEFEIETSSGTATKKDYIDDLNQFLLTSFSDGGNAILIIDEAQNLSHNTLEQIRMLSNLETTREKLIQIILVGQPELNDILSSPSLRQLNERVMVRHHLEALDFKDIKNYVEHRLLVAGGKGTPRFRPGAFKTLYSYSGGNPRRINSVCDRALLIAYAKDSTDITKDMIRASVKELQADKSLTAWKDFFSPGRILIYSALLLVLITAASLTWFYRENKINFSSLNVEPEVTLPRPSSTEILKPRKKIAPLFLDEQESLSRLFSLYYGKAGLSSPVRSELRLNLVNFDMDPEYYIALKKPFRVSVSESSSPPKYLLIIDTSDNKATAIDAEGNKRDIDRDFILNNWGRNVSWVYPPHMGDTILSKGMSGSEVIELQDMLNATGYIVEPTGVFDYLTFQETLKLQRTFGLKADGIAGPRTRALLFQMVG